MMPAAGGALRQGDIHEFCLMVAVGLFPVTGQPLPLISKGGTSTLINCAYIGMILSVSRYVAEKEALREQKEQEANNEKLQAAAQALILQAQEMASTDINANQSIPSESEDNAEAHNDIEQKSSDV